MTSNKCVMCGYEIENEENNISKTSVFDIFDFIDNKEDIVYNKNTPKKPKKYEKNKYKDKKFVENIKKEYEPIAYNKKIQNKQVTLKKQIIHNKKMIKLKEYKKRISLFSILYVVLSFINPFIAIIFLAVKIILDKANINKKG